LSQSSNVAGNQINNVITYITIVPDSSRSVTPTYISSASYIPDSHQHASGSATLTGLKNGTTFPGGPNGSEIVAIALHNFHAREDDEITFVKGERIEQIDKLGQDAKWWAGLAPRGKWGLFPANYVKIIKNLQEGMTGIAAVALYGFDPNEDNELSFVEGDLIEHIYKVNGNWLGGFGPGGTWGLFPANHVQLIGQSDGGTSGIAAIALYNYNGSEDNELSFIEGDLIEYIDKLKNDDWWTGVGPRRKWGLFPANHVKLIA
ncbi:hypothetical protein AX14_012277, partial [Amanita brunnescens Koide BX004]